MKNLYTLLTALALFGVIYTNAQESAMPYPKKSTTGTVHSSPAASPSPEGLQMPPRPEQAGVNNFTIPVKDQIHSPIRWYALENADNPDYWKHVNTSRIWVELEIGNQLTDPAIAEFLELFDLVDPVKQSMHPHLTNFFVFEKPGATAEEVIEMAEAAREVYGVLFLEPSVIYKGNYVPNDPMWNQQWGPYAIYAEDAWEYGTQGNNSWNVLAVVDDAIDWLHEDLTDQVWYGYDYGFNDPDPTLDGDEQTHGTHVTGIMSASNNNGVGIAGMCTDTVYFAKVTDNTYFTQNGSYSNAGIINAVYDISGIERVLAINLSLGGGAPSAAAEMAYNFAWNSGKLPIVASGNEGQGSISFPAGYAACMAVGSVGTDGNELYLTGYSNYGNQQEVSAPGGDINTGYGIISTIPDNQYQAFEGTSMACPHVAGLAGLMKSLNTDLTNVEIRNIINATCFDLGAAGWDVYFGYGMINAKLALDIALGAVSTNDLEADLRLKLYPNPTSDQLWIHNQSYQTSGEFQIFDLNGRLVQSERANSDIFSVNVSNLPEGVYVVHVNTGNHRYTGKFVKSN